MKKIFTILLLTTVCYLGANAQTDAFKGDGDLRYHIGASFQDLGTGITTSLDYGLGESFSIGAQAGYLLGVKTLPVLGKPGFGDRFELKARFNANLGSVLQLPSNVDVYPGLNLGLKNFGGHVGARIFFSKGFGMFAETQFPIAKYNKSALGFENLNNQFVFSFGVAFDLAN